MTKQICKGRLKIVQRLDLWNIMKDRNQEKKKIAARCFTICSSHKFRCWDSVVQGHAVLMRRKCIFFLWFSLFKRHFLDLQPNSHNWHWSNVPKPVRRTSSSISEHMFSLKICLKLMLDLEIKLYIWNQNLLDSLCF